MNEIEAKVRCLELAAMLARSQNIYECEGVVSFAESLYSFVQPSPVTEEVEDKPRRGRPRKLDIDEAPRQL